LGHDFILGFYLNGLIVSCFLTQMILEAIFTRSFPNVNWLWV